MTTENPSYSAETAAKILSARQVGGVPYEERLVSVDNFAHLFRENAAKYGNRPYLIYRDGETRSSFTYAEFFDLVCKTANYLRYKLGMEPGQRVACVAYNHYDTVMVAYACWMVGAVYVPINIGDPDEHIRFVLENAEVRAVFAMPDLLGRTLSVCGDLEGVEHVVQIHGEAKEDIIYLPDAIERQPVEFEDWDLADHDTEALIVYTSGTTGAPKGVVLQQYNMLVEAHAITQWYDFQPEDCTMLILPIHHVNALLLSLFTTLWFGGSVVLNRKFSASGYWQVIEEEECTWGSVVPTILSYLCEKDEDISRRKLKDYFIICGAGPLTVDLGKRFAEKFKIKVNHGYGLSETTVYSCYLPFDLKDETYQGWMEDHGYPSIGVPIACNEMDIQDDNGKSVKEGEKGEIVVRGHNVMKGYFLRPEANEETFKNGWFRTGDEGFYLTDDEDTRFFFITGRLKELIIRGGINYSPLEIDEVINRIPGVKAGMAVGFENDFYGEEVGAYVVKEEGVDLDAESILDACEELSFEKRPKVVVFGEDVPVTATGKYQRNKLKPLFSGYKEAQFRK